MKKLNLKRKRYPIYFDVQDWIYIREALRDTECKLRLRFFDPNPDESRDKIMFLMDKVSYLGDRISAKISEFCARQDNDTSSLRDCIDKEKLNDI